MLKPPTASSHVPLSPPPGIPSPVSSHPSSYCTSTTELQQKGGAGGRVILSSPPAAAAAVQLSHDVATRLIESMSAAPTTPSSEPDVGVISPATTGGPFGGTGKGTSPPMSLSAEEGLHLLSALERSGGAIEAAVAGARKLKKTSGDLLTHQQREGLQQHLWQPRSIVVHPSPPPQNSLIPILNTPLGPHTSGTRSPLHQVSQQDSPKFGDAKRPNHKMKCPASVRLPSPVLGEEDSPCRGGGAEICPSVRQTLHPLDAFLDFWPKAPSPSPSLLSAPPRLAMSAVSSPNSCPSIGRSSPTNRSLCGDSASCLLSQVSSTLLMSSQEAALVEAVAGVTASGCAAESDGISGANGSGGGGSAVVGSTGGGNAAHSGSEDPLGRGSAHTLYETEERLPSIVKSRGDETSLQTLVMLSRQVSDHSSVYAADNTARPPPPPSIPHPPTRRLPMDPAAHRRALRREDELSYHTIERLDYWGSVILREVRQLQKSMRGASLASSMPQGDLGGNNSGGGATSSLHTLEEGTPSVLPAPVQNGPKSSGVSTPATPRSFVGCAMRGSPRGSSDRSVGSLTYPTSWLVYEFDFASRCVAPAQLKCLASANVIGKLFDFNGDRIRSLQNEFDIRVYTSSNRVFYPGTGKQVLLLKGQAVDILRALRTVFLMMVQDVVDVDLLPGDFDISWIKLELSVIIPSATCSKLLSQMGAQIQWMQQQSNARIHVTCMRFEHNHIQERLATISGRANCVERGVELMTVFIQDDPGIEAYDFLSYPLYTKAFGN